MPVIVIDAAAHCHGPEVADGLAAHLGLDRRDDARLFAAAAERFGVAAKKLDRLMHGPSSFFGTPKRERVRLLAVLRACLADEVATDRWIYQGLAGHLLPGTLTHVLKVCLAGTRDWRIEQGMAAGLTRKEAERQITRDDEVRAEWTGLVADARSLGQGALRRLRADAGDSVARGGRDARGLRPGVGPDPDSGRDAGDPGLRPRRPGRGTRSPTRVTTSTCSRVTARSTVLIKQHSLFLERHQRELEEIARSVDGVREVAARPGPALPRTGRGVQRRARAAVEGAAGRRRARVRAHPLGTAAGAPLHAGDRLRRRAGPGDGRERRARGHRPRPQDAGHRRPRGAAPGQAHQPARPRSSSSPATARTPRRSLAADLGAFAYLRKPVDIDVLTDTMKAAYRKISAAREEPADG